MHAVGFYYEKCCYTILAKNMNFLPFTQMMPPHLLHLKKIRGKHKIITPIIFFFLFYPFPGFWVGAGQCESRPETHTPAAMGHSWRPTHQPHGSRPTRLDPVVTHGWVTPWLSSLATFSPDLATKFIFYSSKSVSNVSKFDYNVSKLIFWFKTKLREKS